MAAPARTWPLQAVIVATAVFGAVLVLMPAAARGGFALLIFGDSAAMASWPAAAQTYVTLLHGVLGAVMLGWALALLRLQRATASPRGRWFSVVLSVGVWYLVDSGFSAAMGAWPNVALNSVFGAAFALALWLARPASGPDTGPEAAPTVQPVTRQAR